MDYGEVLSKAWKIIWRFKILWIFGILASCSGNFRSSTTSGSNNGVRYTFPEGSLPPGIENFFVQLTHTIEGIQPWVWVLLFAALLVLIVIWVVLATVGHVGLIKGTSQADDGAERLTFGALFNEGMHYFWRVFLLNLMVGLAVFAAVVILFLIFIVAGIVTLGLALLCLIPLACLLIPASWVLSVLIEQSTIAIVVEDVGIIEGLQRGWDVIKRNVGPMVVMALTLGIGAFIAGIILALPVALVFIPPVVSLIFVHSLTGAGIVLAVVIFVIYLPIWLVLSGIVRSYVSASWTLTYRRLTGRKPISLAPAAMEPAPVS
jgi:hypothetical protein